MTEKDYVAVYVQTDPRFCYVDFLGDLENQGDFSDAVPRKHQFPAGLKVDLSPDGGDMITDFVNNGERILIASRRAKDLLEKEGIGAKAAEFLGPIVLRDRRRKAIKEPYYIVNVLTTVECFDWKKSVYETFDNSPREISPVSLEVLHIHAEKVPRGVKLFRIAEIKRELIIRTDLLETLRGAGCEGLCVVPMGEERI